MEINQIKQSLENLKEEKEKLQKVHKIHQISPVKKDIYNNRDQEKSKKEQNQSFEEIFETELKRVKKLEE